MNFDAFVKDTNCTQIRFSTWTKNSGIIEYLLSDLCADCAG